MATRLICETCGAEWEEIPGQHYDARLFSTATYAVGSYPSLTQILAAGEPILTCPKDPQPDLDAAINGPGSRFHPERRVIPGEDTP